MSVYSPVDSRPASVFDVNGLATIKAGLKTSDPKALKAAAQQFEALFMQMVLKSMRDATPHEGMFDSEQTRFYESLLDSQLSHVLSGKGGKGGLGLAAMIEKQLSRPPAVLDSPIEPMPLQPALRSLPLPASGTQQTLPGRDKPAPAAPPPLTGAPGGAREFITRLWPEAEVVASETGIPASYVIGHAALESGWGRNEPRSASGQPSYNLFGIKASRGWRGAVVESTTTEYVNGAAEQRVERFRAYSSYAEAFRDYAQLLATSPRYAEVTSSRDVTGFAQGLQRAGYATDPAYAAKLERIISGPTLRQALTG